MKTEQGLSTIDKAQKIINGISAIELNIEKENKEIEALKKEIDGKNNTLEEIQKKMSEIEDGGKSNAKNDDDLPTLDTADHSLERMEIEREMEEGILKVFTEESGKKEKALHALKENLEIANKIGGMMKEYKETEDKNKKDELLTAINKEINKIEQNTNKMERDKQNVSEFGEEQSEGKEQLQEKIRTELKEDLNNWLKSKLENLKLPLSKDERKKFEANTSAIITGKTNKIKADISADGQIERITIEKEAKEALIDEILKTEIRLAMKDAEEKGSQAHLEHSTQSIIEEEPNDTVPHLSSRYRDAETSESMNDKKSTSLIHKYTTSFIGLIQSIFSGIKNMFSESIEKENKEHDQQSR